MLLLNFAYDKIKNSNDVLKSCVTKGGEVLTKEQCLSKGGMIYQKLKNNQVCCITLLNPEEDNNQKNNNNE